MKAANFCVLFWFLSTACVAAETDRCLQCHGGTPVAGTPSAPALPHAFSMDWKMFEFAAKQRPPFAVIPSPHSVLRGSTYYDWSKQAMTEVYRDKCIDIFADGRDFPCRFTSVKDSTHLVRYTDTTLAVVQSCCVWNATGFWAPRPDVVSHMRPQKRMRLNGRGARWWMLDIPLPGPFGFGFFNDGTPAAFWFPVISGWVQQNFENLKRDVPAASAFQLPDACNGSPVCGEP